MGFTEIIRKCQEECACNGMEIRDNMSEILVGKLAEELDKNGAGGGGGADILNENGIIKQQHLPDGYPYKEVGNDYILPATEPVYDDATGYFTISSGVYASMFTIGEIYTVNWNGVDYECVALDASMWGSGPVGFGNLGFVTGGDDTGEPFVIVVLPLEAQAERGGAAVVLPRDGSTPTLSISGKTDLVTKIGKEYLPDDIGGVTSYNDLTDKPFWKETEKIAIHTEPISVTTTDMGGMNGASGVLVKPVPETTNYVVFDGIEYECAPYFSEEAQSLVLGSLDFGKYPFLIAAGLIVTKTAETHTVQQFYDKSIVKSEYAPHLNVVAHRDDDRKPYLDMEDVEKILNAYSNGVPILIDEAFNQTVTLHVEWASEHFIYATGYMDSNMGVGRYVACEFSTVDGRGSTTSFRLGEIDENANILPVMYINNRYYKITVASDGTLKATEI